MRRAPAKDPALVRLLGAASTCRPLPGFADNSSIESSIEQIRQPVAAGEIDARKLERSLAIVGAPARIGEALEAVATHQQPYVASADSRLSNPSMRRSFLLSCLMTFSVTLLSAGSPGVW